MGLKIFLLGVTATTLLVAAMPAVAAGPTLDECVATPKRACVDVIINGVMEDLATDPGLAERSDHVSRIANMLVHTPRLKQAEELAAFLPDGMREGVLEGIALRHAILGEPDESRRLLPDLVDERSRDSVRLEIVRAEMKAGNEDIARALIAGIGTPPMRDGAINAVADALLTDKRIAETLDLIALAEDSTIRFLILGRVLRAAEDPEIVGKALQVAAAVPDPRSRIQGMGQLAVILAARDKKAEAGALFDRIDQALAEADLDDAERRSLLDQNAGRLAEAGFYERALKAIAQLDAAEVRINLLTYIAHNQRQRGQPEEAERLYAESVTLAKALDDATARDKQLGFVVARLTRSDIPLRENADTIVVAIADPVRRGEAMRVLARQFASMDRFALAEERLRSIDDTDMRVQGLMDLAWMLAEKGWADKGLKLLEEIIQAHGSPEAFRALSVRTQQQILMTAGKLGRFRQARELAMHIEVRDTRIVSLMDIALSTMDAGLPEAGRVWLHDAVREADQVIDGVRRTDLVYRLSFQTEAIGGLAEISALMEELAASDMRQLFLYEVARFWLPHEKRRADARELMSRFGSSDTKHRFRHREIETAFMLALLEEAEQK